MATLRLPSPLALAPEPTATFELPAAVLAVLLEPLASKPMAILLLVKFNSPAFGPTPLALARPPTAVLALLSPNAFALLPNALLSALFPCASAAVPAAAFWEAAPLAFATPQAKLSDVAALAPAVELPSEQANGAAAAGVVHSPIAKARPKPANIVRVEAVGLNNEPGFNLSRLLRDRPWANRTDADAATPMRREFCSMFLWIFDRQCQHNGFRCEFHARDHFDFSGQII
jgi:hypothetical protein